MGCSFPQVNLNDIAHIVMGQSPEGSTYNKVGDGIPLLNGPTEFGSSHPVPALWTTSPTKICSKGDILFCVRGSTTGRMNWSDKEYCIGRGIGAFSAKASATDTRFLWYNLIYELPRLLSLSAGSVFPNLARQDFETFSVNWPDKPIRAAIASILGAIDDKIELNRKMNETLEAMARAVFKSWFVAFDPILTIGPHKEWQDSQVGKIPKGWRLETVADIAKLHSDIVTPGDFPNEVFEHFSIPAFDEGKMPARDLGVTIKSNKFLLPENCVLISKLNPRIPRIWLPKISKLRAIASTEFLVLVPKKPCTKEFIYSLCISAYFIDTFTSLVTGTSSSHQRVKPEDLLSIKIVCPTDLVLEEFTQKVQPLFMTIQSNNNQTHTLAVTRDTLLPKLLSGEMRVKDAEKFVAVA